MQITITLIECMLSVLMLTICYRTCFRLRENNRFLAFPFFVCVFLIWFCVVLLPFWGSVILVLLILGLYVAYVFSGEAVKMILFGLSGSLMYLLFYLACHWYLMNNLEGYMSSSLIHLCALLLSELFQYTGMFIYKMNRDERKVPITYYFPTIPLLLTLVFIHFFAPNPSMPNPKLLGTMVTFILLTLIVFDFVCLSMQSYLIALLHNRNALRLEKIRQEILKNRYQVLKEQYQNSFSFLHSLLRNCVDLSIDIEQENITDIKDRVNTIAGLSFSEFNDVCISTPILNELLARKKNEIEQENIIVSTVLRSDHFGLLTFDEQRDLFDDLLTFSIHCISRSNLAVRTLVIKSLEDNRDIILYFRFGVPDDPEKMNAFQEIRKKLSRKYSAGVQVSYDTKTHICTLILVMPVSATRFSWDTSSEKSSRHFLP